MWIEELPNGKYKYFERYKDPYTEKYRRVSVTLNSKSNQAKKQAMMELQEKINGKNETTLKRDMTFGSLISEWIVYYPKTVKERTFSNYKYPIKIIEAYFESDYLIKNITKVQIKKVINELYYQIDYSLNYVKIIKNVLCSIFDYAVNMEYMETNPAKNIEIKKKPLKISSSNNISEKYLEHHELVKLIKVQASKLYGERNARLTEFIALTGTRFGEVVSLKAEDFDGSSIYINKTLDYLTYKNSEAHTTVPKTDKSIRKIDLSDRAIQIINCFIEENKFNKMSNDYIDRDFIFTTKTGNPIMISNFNYSLKKAANEASIKKHVTSHILRHTHISMLAELGVPIKAIMDRVGHEEADTTLKIYTHVTDNMKQVVINKLNSIAPLMPPSE